MSKRHKLAYVVSISTPTPYAQLRIQVLRGDDVDAAKEYDREANTCCGEYYLERLQKIREAGASTRYFRSLCSDYRVCTLVWQADRESTLERGQAHWYAFGAQDAAICPDAAWLFAQLVKADFGWYADPAAVIDLLEKLGARHVQCAEPMDAWIYVPSYDRELLQQSPWPLETALASAGGAA